MSLSRLKSQEKDTDQLSDHPDLLVYAHQNFIISLLRTLKKLTSENKQYYKDIKHLSDKYKKSMNDIFSTSQKIDSERELNTNNQNDEIAQNQIIRQIRLDLMDLKLRFELLSLDIDQPKDEKNSQNFTNESKNFYKIFDDFCNKQNEEISFLKNSIQSLNDKIQNTSNDEIEQNSPAQNSIDEFTKKMINFQKKINELPSIKNDVEQIIQDVETLKQNSESMKQEINEQKSSIDDKTKNQNANITKLKKIINFMNDKITKKNNESNTGLENVKKELSDMKNEIQKENETKLNELKEKISSEKSTEITHIKKTLAVLIKDYNANKATTNSFCAEIGASVNDLKSQIRNLESSNKDNQIQNRDIQIDQKLQEIKDEFGKQIQNIQSNCGNSIQSFRDSNSKLNSEIEQIKSQKSEIDELTQKVQDLQSSLNNNNTNESNENNQKVIDELSESISSLKNEMTNEINQLSSNVNDQISQLQDEVDSLKDKQQTVVERSIEIGTTNDENKERRDDEIRIISTQIKCLKYELKKLKTNQSNTRIEDDSINEVKKDLSQMKTQVNSLLELPSQYKEQNKVLDLIKDELKELIKSNNQLSSEFDQSLNDVREEIKKVKSSQLDHGILKKEIIDDIMKDGESIAVIESNIRSLKGRIFELNRSTRCLKYEIKHIKERQNEVEELVNSSKLLNDISQLKKQVSELQELSKQNNDKPILNDQIEKLKEEVGKLMNDSPDIEKKIMSTKNQLKKEILNEIMNDGESTEVIESNIRNIKGRIFELNRSTRCLKYEIKHVKERQNEVEELVNSSKILNDIANLKKQSSELQDSHIELSKQSDKLNKSVSCIKYEVKNLKKSHEILNDKEEKRCIKERSAPIITYEDSDIDELKKQMKELQTNNDKLNESIELHGQKTDDTIRCIKYELKEVKRKTKEIISSNENKEIENAKSIKLNEERHQNINNKLNELSNINDKHNQILSCIKYEIKNLKQSNGIHQATEENIQNELEKQSTILRCIKYELKTLKNKQNTLENKEEAREIKERSAPIITYDDSDINELKKQLTTQQEITDQQNETITSTIQCLKHELKKLVNKENQEIEQLRSTEKSDYDSLQAEILPLKTQLMMLQADFQVTNFNVKKLTKTASQRPTHSITPSPSEDFFELKKQIEDHSRKLNDMKDDLTASANIFNITPQVSTDEFKQLQRTVNCLKYEFKKLIKKENQDIEQIQSDLKSNVDSVINELLPLKTQLTTLQADFQVTNFNVKKLTKAASQKPAHTIDHSASEDFFEIKKQIEDHYRQINDMKEDLTPTTNRENIEQLKKTIDCMKHEIKKLISKENQEIEQLQSIIKSNYDSLQSEILPLKTQLTTLQADFQVTNFNVKKLTKAASQKPAHNIAASPSEDFFELKKQLEDHHRQINDMKEDLTQSTNNFNATPQINNEQFEKLNKVISCLKYEIRKINKKESQEIEQLQSIIKSNYDSLQSEILPLKTQLTTLQADFQVTNFNVKKLTKAASQKPALNITASPSEDFFELKKQLEDHHRQINDMKEDLTQNADNALNSINNENFDKINKSISCLKYEIRKLKKSQEEQPAFGDIKTRSIQTLNDESNSNNNEIESLKSEIENLKEQNEKRIEEETKQFDSINSDLLSLRSSFSNISADLQATQFKLKKIGNNAGASKTIHVEGGPSSEEFFDLEKKVNENKLELEDVKQNLSKLQDKTKILNEFDDKLESMNQRLDDANLSELKDKINTLNAENTVIKSKIKQGILNEPNSKDRSPDEINKLKKQIKDINDNIDDINRFVDAFKERIISIEDKLPPSESSSASGSDDEDAIKSNTELINELPKLKDELNYHSFTISENVKGIRNLHDTIKELTDQVNKHTLTFEYYGRSINMLKRSLKQLNDNDKTKERAISNATNNNDNSKEQPSTSASASASASDTEEHNDDIENNESNVTLNDDALIDLEILKKEFAEFKKSTSESIKCIKHEVKKLIKGSVNEKKKKEDKSNKRTSLQDDVFGEITNHQMLVKLQKEISDMKSELNDLTNRNNKSISNRNIKIDQEEDEEDKSGSDIEEDNDSKDNNKQDKSKQKDELTDERLEVLRRILKWNYVEVSPEVYIDKETKNHFVPSPVLPIISTLIEEEFFKSSNVDKSIFYSAMELIKNEFPHIKMNSQDSRFICTYFVMNLINSNSSKYNFEKERVDFFNQTFTPIMNLAATVIVLPLIQNFTLFINRFSTGSFEVEPLKKDFSKILNSCIEDFKLNYSPNINSYLQKVLFALIDQKIANRILSNPSRFDYESVNNWLEYINSNEIDFNITKQIVNCLNKSFEISNDSKFRKDLCPDLDDAQVVFLLKNYVPDPKLNQQKIDIKAVTDKFGYKETDSISPITNIELPKVQSNEEFDNEIFRDLARNGIQKELLQSFSFLSKYIDN